MVRKKNTEARIIWLLVCIMFAAFLAFPAILLLVESFQGESGLSFQNYVEVFGTKGFAKALRNSFAISAALE